LTDILEKYASLIQIREITSDVILCLINTAQLAGNYFPGKKFTSAALPAGEFDVFFNESGIFPSDRFPQFKVFKRQIEWCAGRLAFAVLSQKYFGAVYLIQTNERGAPFIDSLPNSVSISHSGDYAGSVISLNEKTVAAVDMEHIREFDDISGFLRVAFPEEELAEMIHLPLREIYRLWTLKECFLKIIGTGFGENLKSIRITDNSFVYNGREFYDIFRNTFNMDDHIVSVIHTDLSIANGLPAKLGVK
jgi:phosphopantetheinyl transferase